MVNDGRRWFIVDSCWSWRKGISCSWQKGHRRQLVFKKHDIFCKLDQWGQVEASTDAGFQTSWYFSKRVVGGAPKNYDICMVILPFKARKKSCPNNVCFWRVWAIIVKWKHGKSLRKNTDPRPHHSAYSYIFIAPIILRIYGYWGETALIILRNGLGIAHHDRVERNIGLEPHNLERGAK